MSLYYSSANVTNVYIDVQIGAIWSSYYFNVMYGSLIDMTEYSGTISKINVTIVGDNAKFVLYGITLSDIPKQIMQRKTLLVDYTTNDGITTLEFGDSLLRWDLGSLVISDGQNSYTRATTVIDFWSEDLITVCQKASTPSGTQTITYRLWNDGYVSITTAFASGVTLKLVSGNIVDTYSDSYSIIRNVSDTLLRKPDWAAIYSNGVGIGILGIDGLDLSASIPDGWIDIESDSADSILLIPLLQTNMEFVDGRELDATRPDRHRSGWTTVGRFVLACHTISCSW